MGPPPPHPGNMKVLFVEPAIFLNAFAMTLTSPLTAQYVYRRIWEETGNYSFASDSNVSECEKNKSSPMFEFQEEVQKKASLFSLQMEMSGLIPGLVSTFILLSNSDLHGRKLPMILSSAGALATSIWLCLLSYFAFPFQLLIASTFLGALCGNYTTFWGACLAYIVDQCKEHKQKIIRIAVIDFILGLVTGLTGLASGYFIRELGFVWSFVIIAVTLAVNLTYILFFLGDPMKEPSPESVAMSWCEAFKNLFYRTYALFKNASRKRRITLSLLERGFYWLWVRFGERLFFKQLPGNMAFLLLHARYPHRLHRHPHHHVGNGSDCVCQDNADDVSGQGAVSLHHRAAVRAAGHAVQSGSFYRTRHPVCLHCLLRNPGRRCRRVYF